MTQIANITRISQRHAEPLTNEEQVPDEWLHKLAAADADAMAEAAHSPKLQEMAAQLLTHRAFDRARADLRKVAGRTLKTTKVGRCVQ